ncbi:MAG: type IV pilus secretin PilQ [Deltaproteobacteria bacterium]|nr:type IV pilus secretin PilQ [Deltaproteobacteria bacterium]
MSPTTYRNLVSKSILLPIFILLLIGGCASQSPYQSQSQAPAPSPATPVSEPQVVQSASIAGIAVEEQEDSLRVIIKGSEPLTYTVTQMEFPVRLVVDVTGARLEVPTETVSVNKMGITEVWPSEMELSGEPATRIEIGLSTYAANYEVVPSGNDLVINFAPSSAGESPAQIAQNIVDVLIDHTGNSTTIDIVADGTIEDYNHFVLGQPTRLVVDFPGLAALLPFAEKESESPFIEKVRYGNHPDFLRMVFDAPFTDQLPYQIAARSRGITIMIGAELDANDTEPITMASVSPDQEQAPAQPAESLQQKIDLPEAVPPEDKELQEPEPPQSEAGAPISLLAEEASDTTVADSDQETDEASMSEKSMEEPSADPLPTAESTPAVDESNPPEDIAPPTEESPTIAEKDHPAKDSAALDLATMDESGTPRYTGEKISLDFKDADIRNILRLIAEVSNLNVVAGDDVQGTVTIRLTDVPWDQALDVILLSNNLGKTLEGNILRVVPMERLSRERAAEIAEQETAVKLEPLKKGLIPVSYADVDELKNVIQNAKVLSSRGNLETDQRTNTIIVIDIAENIREAERIINQLDTPTPQVLIEAKVVQINPTYTKELGVTWESGYTTKRNDALIGIGGNQGVDIDLDAGSVTTKGTIVDLAPAVGAGSGGAISFGFLNPNFGLFQKIAALEKDEKLEIISSPRIMTLDNQEALIEQGVDLPYLKLSEEGVTSTEFKKATLALKVTPHVTAANSIQMEIEVKKDQKSAQTGASGEPGIDTRRAETNVLVPNGDTVVIGGIYEEISTDIHNSVPFFGRLPIISFMFKNTSTKKEKTELIVFITPTIVQIEKAPTVAVTSDIIE